MHNKRMDWTVDCPGNRFYNPLYYHCHGNHPSEMELQAEDRQDDQTHNHLLYLDNPTSHDTGLYMDAFRPVSGNWCWLKAKPTILRYALGHNWRLTIIFFTICLYTYLFIYIHRHFASLRSCSSPNDNRNTSEQMSESSGESGLSGITIYEEFEIVDEPFDAWWDVQIPTSEMEYFDLSPPRSNDAKEAASSPPLAPLEIIKQNFHPYAQTGSNRPNETTPFLKTRDPLAIVRRLPPPNVSTTIQVTPSVAATLWSREIDIQKLLLLNAYPIGYIILWIPGIANRFVELSGHRVRGLAIAQASTQFVGLANALVYGYNERIWSLTKLWWKNKRARVINNQKRGENRIPGS
ncbi:hypothetical protein BKA61DRAFT_678917 [Leptodontidium sp. MPI-SDFR-AT-0119]|nr:hypothetical protein BKA61DRAFT_678917 [Leptodontidium sp. MPI-SDFR-AT-0119]